VIKATLNPTSADRPLKGVLTKTGLYLLQGSHVWYHSLLSGAAQETRYTTLEEALKLFDAQRIYAGDVLTLEF
jgi:predicted GNAT superfamily acetyltransferase